MRKFSTSLAAITLGISLLGVFVPRSSGEEPGNSLPGSSPLAVDTDFDQVISYVTHLVERDHYLKRDFDKKMGQEVVRKCLEVWDPEKLFFTATVAESLASNLGDGMHQTVFEQGMTPAREIFGRYRELVTKRMEKIRVFLSNPVDLSQTATETTVISRQSLSFPANEAAADEMWRRRLVNDLIVEHLAMEKRQKANAAAPSSQKAGVNPKEPKKGTAAKVPAAPAAPAAKMDTPEQKVIQFYENFAKTLADYTDEEICARFLSSICQTFDPHSDYLSAPDTEEFENDMKKQLVGIGIRFQGDEGQAVIETLIAGGPAHRSGHIRPGDRIVGVGQGPAGEISPVEGLRSDKIAEKIRGEIGSQVRLELVPVADPTKRAVVTLKREQVELKESRARADLFETPKSDGSVSRVGWIVLDNFYGDQDKKTISATEDVSKLLDRLMAEKMESLVIDLRGNPGGYLEEGVALSGLFLKSGPVVQERDARGRMTLKKSRPTEAKYNGPLVVLTDRYSASASEIFAAAMQDRGRAVVVGDHATFGKGTVQAVLDVGDYLPAFVPSERAGSVKLTIRKFYRIAGGSTQLKGVVPDIILPSRLEASVLGEDSMKGALEYDTMDKLPYEMASSAPLPMSRLKQSSEARLLIDPEFGHIREDYQRLKSQNEKNEISLDLEARRQEWLALEESAARRAVERKSRLNAPVFQQKAYRLTVDNLKDADLVPLAKVLATEKGTNLHEGPDSLAGGDFPLGLEPVKCETLNIARDLAEVAASPKETARR